MKIDCVFSGGGVKSFAFIGVCKSMDLKGYQIERTAGTSAGAIFACLIAAGFSITQIDELIKDLQLKQLLDPPPLSKFPLIKWLSFYFQKGLYKGDKLEDWIRSVLSERDIYTFGDLKENYLKVIVSDISLGKLVVIPDDLNRLYGINPKFFSIAKAVRMSASFPYFFMPQPLINMNDKKSYIVDGGLLSNFPLWIFRQDNSDTRPVLGMTLSDKMENAESADIHNALDMLHALFTTMQKAHDARYIAKSKEKNIIFIPVNGFNSMDLNISEGKREKLIQRGKESADSFLRTWP